MEAPTTGSSCLYCLEPIKPGARRCPHCQSWQSRWAADSAHPKLELALVVSGLVILAGLVLAWSLLARHDASADLAPGVASSLRVTEATIVGTGPGRVGPLAIVGTIANTGNADAKGPYLQVQLFDAGGALLDNFSARAYALIVPAHGQTSFKVVDPAPLHAASDYARCTVEVRWADKAR